MSSFLNTHRLHWGAHSSVLLDLHEHLNLMTKQEPAASAARSTMSASAADIPTEMPSEIIHPPAASQELGA